MIAQKSRTRSLEEATDQELNKLSDELRSALFTERPESLHEYHAQRKDDQSVQARQDQSWVETAYESLMNFFGYTQEKRFDQKVRSAEREVRGYERRLDVFEQHLDDRQDQIDSMSQNLEQSERYAEVSMEVYSRTRKALDAKAAEVHVARENAGSRFSFEVHELVSQKNTLEKELRMHRTRTDRAVIQYRVAQRTLTRAQEQYQNASSLLGDLRMQQTAFESRVADWKLSRMTSMGEESLVEYYQRLALINEKMDGFLGKSKDAMVVDIDRVYALDTGGEDVSELEQRWQQIR